MSEHGENITILQRLKYWLLDYWEAGVYRFYRRTQHYWEDKMHEALMDALLDKLGAPTHPDNNPRRLRYGLYGRLRAYAVQKKLVDPAEIV